jgi:hypothetical protein
MGKTGILASEFIEKNLVALGGALLNHHLHHQTSFFILLVVAAIPAKTGQALVLSRNLEIQVITANGAKANGGLLLIRCIEVGDYDVGGRRCF